MRRLFRASRMSSDGEPLAAGAGFSPENDSELGLMLCVMSTFVILVDVYLPV